MGNSGIVMTNLILAFVVLNLVGLFLLYCKSEVIENEWVSFLSVLWPFAMGMLIIYTIARLIA